MRAPRALRSAQGRTPGQRRRIESAAAYESETTVRSAVANEFAAAYESECRPGGPYGALEKVPGGPYGALDRVRGGPYGAVKIVP